MPKKWIRLTLNLLLTLFILGLAVLLSLLLSQVDNDNNPFAMAIFLLAVALVARFTHGYFWGILAALAATFCVNYMFTFPFWEFDITYTGYPLTMAVMLIVSVLISALTTQIKQQEQLRFEVKREQMQAGLLRAIAHDIRTPLASISGAAATLKNTSLPPPEKEQLLGGIERDAEWLIRLTENLLSITRITQEGDPIKKEDEVLEEIIGSALVKYRRREGSLPVEADTLNEILLVPMDATLIEQVLLNLMENVSAHGKGASGIWIHILQSASVVWISVEDNGAGIAPPLLSRLNQERLVQSSPRADARRSMGIGLSVCRTIVKAHGGVLRIGNSSRHGGAAISFSLPGKEYAI